MEKAIQSIPAERNEDGISIGQTNKQTKNYKGEEKKANTLNLRVLCRLLKEVKLKRQV